MTRSLPVFTHVLLRTFSLLVLFGLTLHASGQNLTLVGLNPARNARAATTTANVNITFDKSLSSNSAILSGLRVFSAQRGGLLVNGRGGSTSVSDRTLVFNPATDFKPGETVFVTSTTAIQSTTGGRLSRGQVFQFTTGVGGSGRGNFNAPPPVTNPDPTVGDSPGSVVLGDVDGDGDLDLVTANAGDNTVSVRLNNGLGTFTAPATNPDPNVGNRPSSVVLGDVDGDGDLDLVTANFDDNTVSVRLNNGSGNFTPPATNPNPTVGTVAGSNPTGVALGDMDGDGNLDLVTTVFKADPASFNGNRVSVRFNNGSGNFAAANADFSFEGYPTSVALGDVNEDGYLDLVIGSITSTGGIVGVRLNNGAGTFTPPATIPDSKVGTFPTSIALGDIDGDGDLDLVTNNKNSNTVSVRLNNGVGAFTAPATNPDPAVGESPSSVALGDVDGDGDLDLVVANTYSPVSVRLNDGTGNFTPPATNPDPTIGAYASGGALGDVDGDSDLDLLVANFYDNKVSVRLNRSLLSPSITGLTANPNPVCSGSPVTLTASLGNITDTYSYTLANDSSAPTSGTGTTTAFRQNLTATGTGVQSFTLTVESNGLHTSATTSLSANVLPSATLANSGALGCAITSVTLTAGGGNTGGAFTYTFSGPGLSSTGLSNQQTVSQAGNYSVIVTNANGCTATASTTVESRTASFTVSNPGSSNGTSGQSFSQSFKGSGGTSPYSYSLASGNLPPGLSLSTTGVLSGAPTLAGSFTLTVKATDAAGCSGVSAPYVLNVGTANPIRYVRAGASGSGDSWADASGDLQSQINIVGTQQVWVAQGTYKPGPAANTNRSLSFSMKNGVVIYGGYAASGNPTSPSERNPASFTTVLSGDIGTVGNSADNSYHVVNNPPGLSNLAVLDGFLIMGGNANGSSAPDDAGGGMLNNGNGASNNCSPLIRNCLFVGNTAANGGGALYNAGYTSGTSKPSLINCAFQSNTAGQGGAIFNDGSVGGTSNPELTNCSFQANSAATGGAMSSVGFQGSSRPVLTNCVVWGNGGGGTFANGPGSSITTSYSLFESSVTGYNAGTGNLTTTTSPFVSATDMRLNGCSQSLNAGDNAAYTSVNGPAADLAGNARIFPANGRIDMGAYEFQTTRGLTVIVPDVSQGPVGVAFSQTFTASGGTSPYSYSLISGSLPAGLSLSTTGVLSGTPTQAGGFPLTVRVTDAAGCSGVSASGAYFLTVFDAGPLPTLTGFAASPGAVCVGGPVTFTATVGNTTGYYNYTLTNGLGTSRDGVLVNSLVSESVTASGTGPQTFTLTVRSNRGLSITSVTTLTVNPLPVASLTNNGPLSCAQPSVTLTASDGSSYTFTSGSEVVGTPGAANTVIVSSPGTYSVMVASASGCVSTTSTTVTGNIAVVTVSNPVTATATINASFSQNFTVSGGTGPYSYSLASGSLPTGLSLANTGVLSGTPTQGGSFTITVKAADAAGCLGVSAPYPLTVSAPATSIRYVKAGASGSGSSWADASGDLQSQINFTGAEQVWVAQGTYKPTGTPAATGTDRTISFSMKNGVAIYGGFAGTETSLSQRPAINPVSGNPSSTTLSGDIGTAGNNSDNSYHVIYNFSGLTPTAVLDGFVITGGRADGSGAGQNSGGGLYNDGSGTGKSCSPLIQYCSFLNNSATENGAALFNDGSFAGRSSPVLTNCLFQNNSASAGGAIFNKGESSEPNTESGSSPVLTNCSFLTNTAAATGGAIVNDAQGSGRSNPTLTNCSFRGNTAANVGGAIHNNGIYSGLGSPTLTNCSFQSNAAKRGGAIYNDAYGDGTSSPTLINCSFQGNLASEYGGAMYSKAIVGTAVSTPTLTNCVVFGNGGGNTFAKESGSVVVATYSLFDDSVGDYSGSNNLTTTISPFVSTTDARLNACSPAINAGLNSANGTATDLAGNSRVYQNGRIDMGAYEYQAAPTVSLSAPSVNTATVGVAFSQTFTTSGGSNPYSYSLASGSLPPGLTLATTGVLSGTLTQTGSFTLTVLATDATGCAGLSAPYTLTVTQPAPTQPDLAPILYARPTLVYGQSPLTVVVDVVELNSIATSGSFSVRVTRDQQLRLSFDANLTRLDGRSVQNNLWRFSDVNPNYYVLTTSQPIAPGDKLSFGLSGSLDTGASSGMLTVSATVQAGTLVESRLNNNIDADKVEYFQQ